MAKLILESGGEPREFPLSDVCRVGREQGNEIVLDDNGASRRHCRIAREGDGWVLEDLKSANGTFRNEERIDRVRLAAGDQIRVGGTILRFTTAEAGELQLEQPAPAGGKARFEIVFVSGERSGDRLALTGARITLGRKSSNTVALKDSKVSGVHCEVALEDGRPVLRDLGSTNGTFLEGKRIDEIVLDHGDRVAVGETEFVLGDKTRGTLGGAAEFLAEASQTLVNIPKVTVVRDVPRTRRSPAALLGLVLLIGALGGAAWFYWQAQSQAQVAAAPPPAAGNLLGDRWSFEPTDVEPEPASAWRIEATTATMDVAGGAARSGGQGLLARPSGGAAVATLRAPLRAAGRRYQVSAFVRAEGEAIGAVAALFEREGDGAFHVVVPVGSVDEGDWREVAGEVVPPTGATSLAVTLTAIGNGGSVSFDDVAVVEDDVVLPEPVALNQFEFERAGETVLVRRGNELLRIGPLTFEAPEGGVPRPADRFRHDGEVILPDGGRTGYASSLVRGERSVAWRMEWQEPADGTIVGVHVPLELLPALMDEPVGVAHGTRLEPFQEAFTSDDVDGLVLGKGATRLRIAFDVPVAVEGRPDGDRFRLLLRPPRRPGRLTLDVQVDFVGERTQAGSLISEAREAQRARRLGQALAILGRITNEFPFDEAVLAEADTRQREIVAERERVAGSLAATMERARFLRSPTAYLEAEEEARAAATAFEGTPSHETFRQQEIELAGERQSLVQAARERRAALLLERLETALAQEPPRRRIAREIADALTKRFPGSAAARTAESRLRESDGS